MRSSTRAFALLLSLFLLFTLSACEDKNPGKTDSSSSESKEPDISSVLSVGTESGDVDPENTEIGETGGASVNAENLHHETGKANGVDVSKWQGRIDWAKVKKDGIDFAIIRVGYRGEDGVIYKDSNADYNIQQAAANGVLIGVYFFSTAVNKTEARQEADWTTSMIAGYPISYPVVYDCEGFDNLESRMNKVTAEERTENALAFLNAVSDRGYDGMMYSSAIQLQNSYCWITERISSKYRIWVANYTNPPYPATPHPDYDEKYDMWQYTNKGTVSGISGNCDLVVSFFIAAEQKPKNGAAAPQKADPPKTAEEMKYTEVNDNVTAKIEVNLRDAATTKSNVVGVLKKGEFIKRIAKGSNGWSKLLYNGKTVFAITSYLTTDPNYAAVTPPKEDIVAGNTFTKVSDKVTAKEKVNLRALPTTDSEILGSLSAGTYLERTATSNRGWSRLNYNGQVVYAITSYLTTDKVTGVSSTQGTTSTDDGFRVVNDRVTAKIETNLRDKPTTEGSNVIYTLKNGEYITRIGMSDSGWSKLDYNGQTVYAISSYLTK